MRNWAIFWLLGVVWGSSFLLIKVAVEDLGPLPLVSIRIGLAALFMAAFLALTGRRVPSGRRERLALLFVGVMNTALPFTLITWGEQHIDSGLATVLNATVPLWTLIFAHVALYDERFSRQKLIGLLVGFAGVALLASRNGSGGSENSLAGQAAVLVASACYALSAVVIRRYLRGVEPLTIAGTSLIVGGVVVVAVTLATVSPLPALSSLDTTTLAATLTLALLNTVFAYFLFYHLIDTWGATRTTLVTYVMPPVGVTLGWLLLEEPVDWKIIVGAALILGGIVAVNWRRTPVPAAPVRGAHAPGSD